MPAIAESIQNAWWRFLVGTTKMMPNGITPPTGNFGFRFWDGSERGKRCRRISGRFFRPMENSISRSIKCAAIFGRC